MMAPNLPAAPQYASSPSARCSDGLTRERGLQALAKWLSSRENVNDMDMQKIWKGLFYAFWHSDKAPVQVLDALRPASALRLPTHAATIICT